MSVVLSALCKEGPSPSKDLDSKIAGAVLQAEAHINRLACDLSFQYVAIGRLFAFFIFHLLFLLKWTVFVRFHKINSLGFQLARFLEQRNIFNRCMDTSLVLRFNPALIMRPAITSAKATARFVLFRRPILDRPEISDAANTTLRLIYVPLQLMLKRIARTAHLPIIAAILVHQSSNTLLGLFRGDIETPAISFAVCWR